MSNKGRWAASSEVCFTGRPPMRTDVARGSRAIPSGTTPPSAPRNCANTLNSPVPWRMSCAVLEVRKDRALPSTCTASSRLVLPLALAPQITLSWAGGSSAHSEMQRRLRTSSRDRCMAACDDPGETAGRRSSPNGSAMPRDEVSTCSQAHGHDHILAALRALRAQQATAVRVGEAHQDAVVLDGVEGVQQVRHVEADLHLVLAVFDRKV